MIRGGAVPGEAEYGEGEGVDFGGGGDFGRHGSCDALFLNIVENGECWCNCYDK